MPCRPTVLGEVEGDCCWKGCCWREHGIYYKQLSGLWSENYAVQSELLIVLQRMIVSIRQCSGVHGSNVC